METPMISQRQNIRPRLVLVVLAGLAVACAAAFSFPPVREAVQKLLGPAQRPDKPQAVEKAPQPLQLITDNQGHDGLRISAVAMANYQVDPVAAEPAVRARPLPPQPGKLNYDIESYHIIRPRFQGEVIELKQVADGGHPPYGPESKRPLRPYDRVKQGDVLAVLWCKDLGVAKAALVDAIQNLRLSKAVFERQQKLFEQGTISQTTLEASQRQFQIDTGALLTAERLLRIWQYSDQDIEEIKKEANSYLDRLKQNGERNLKEEISKWARVEVPVPRDQNDPNREFVVLEKNTNVHDFVDPGRDTPLFRLADLKRLQIWVHPPEEYVPLLRERLDPKKHPPGTLRWLISFQAEPNQAPLDLPITLMAPSLDPNNYTPMLVGYLNDPDRKHIVGQFVTATILVPPPEDTVEVPTDAINQYEGQNYVFVQDPQRKDQFFLRRIALVSDSGGKSLVRSKLTPEDKKLSDLDAGKPGRRAIEPLQPGERVITKGVVELTSALDELVTNRAAEQQAAQEQGG
jgi:cobalt-zinc-cadmium efflux system membrane fusion protein